MSVEMKDSGIAWIGEIPKNWEVTRIKNICNVNTSILPDKTDKELVISYVDIGSVNYEQGIIAVESLKFKNAPSRARRIAHINDIIVSTVRTYLRAMDIIDTDEKSSYIYSTGFAILTPNAKVNPHYLIFVCKSEYFTTQVANLSSGINYPSINTTNLNGIFVFLPDKEEQSRIANFLDKKCAEIDELIALQEQMIAQLNTYKQAVITETVTKGLDPNVKMKDSGVGWIGEIPEHWRYDRLKNLFSLHRGYDLAHEEFINQGVPVYGSGGFMGYHNKVKVIAPNIIIGRSGSVGKLHFIKEDFWAHNTGIYINDDNGNNMKYIYYILTVVDMDSMATKTAVPTLDRKKIQEHFSVFTLIYEEQQSIARYLDQKCKEIDELISIKKEKIEHLKAYKKSVIYEYVTGKKHTN